MLKNLNIKKITLWLSVTTIACLAIAALLFFEIDLKDFKSNKYQYDVNEQENFNIENIKAINIDAFSSDINIIEYDDTKVKVHIYGKLYNKKKNEQNEPVIELIDGKLNVKENRISSMHVGINLNIGEWFKSNEMQIDLFIPKGYRESMNIDSASGNVIADPLNLKELDINTFSGDIKLKDVSAETVNLETSSGNIYAGIVQADDIKINSFSGNNDFKSIKAERVYIDNSSGDLSLGTVEAEEVTWNTFSGDIDADSVISDNVELSSSSGHIRIEGSTVGKIKCETFSGDITVNNAALNDSVIDTSSGYVTIGLLEGSEFSLVADSSSGKVSCNFPISAVEKPSEHKIRGVVGKSDNILKINTFSGDIKIRLAE